MNYDRCFTPRSVVLSIVGMALAQLLIHFSSIASGFGWQIGREGLPLIAIVAFVLILGTVALLRLLFRRSILTQGELLFVLAACVFSVPLTMHGFWRRSLSAATTATSPSNWERYDVVPWELRPQGRDILQPFFDPPREWTVSTEGSVAVTTAVHSDGRESPALVLENQRPGDHALFRLAIPLETGNRANLFLGSEYLFTLLARAERFAGDTEFRARITYDDDPVTANELLNSLEPAAASYLQPEGFRRTGRYGVVFERTGPDSHINLEFSLNGTGRVTLVEPRMINIGPLTTAYSGRPVILRSEWEQLPTYLRDGFIVRPDNLVSLRGLWFLVTGYVPWSAWSGILGYVGTWTLLLLTASFALVLIMRRQWMESERFPLPMDQPAIALLGPTESAVSGDGAGDITGSWRDRLPAVLRSPACWIGVGAGLIWHTFAIAHAFNAAIPSPETGISLSSYISGPLWGKTWQVSFQLNLAILALALFMELNVLASVVIGFLLYRLQFLVGLNTGWSVDGSYPHGRMQTLGALTAYALLIPLLSIRYLRNVFRSTFTRGSTDPETTTFRVALVLLAVAFAGVVVWALRLGVPLHAALLGFLLMLAFCLAAARLRSEAGILHGASFGEWKGWTMPQLLIPFCGGLAFFGAETSGAMTYIGIMILGSSFLLIPGFQIAFLEIGRRWRVRPSHVAAATAMGILGGIFIGGWFFLSSIYSVGAENYTITEYGTLEQHFAPIDEELRALDNALDDPAGAPAGPPVDLRMGALIYAGSLTVIVTLLRQFFAAFWFHPIGIIVGPADAMNFVWASALVAMIIRFTVLKLGGASTVREKLYPFATGLFLAAGTALLARVLIRAAVNIVTAGGSPY